VNTWKVILATLVIFGAGVVTGGLIVSLSNRESKPLAKIASADDPARPPDGETNRAPVRLPPPVSVPQHSVSRDFLTCLDRELKLSPEQRERIKKIIAEGQEQTKTLWKTIEPDVHKEMREIKDKIRAELTPEQQTRFNELLKPRSKQKSSEEKHPGAAPSTNAPSQPNP
jgi:hypothetical protein